MISVSFAHDRLSVCVGDVALSLSNKVSYLSQDTLNNKLSTCKYLHINFCFSCRSSIKVARYSFSRSIPPKFERKLRRHKQGFGKIDTTVVLDKDENWL